MRSPIALAMILVASALLPLVPSAAAEATLSDDTGDVTLESGTPAGGLASPAGVATSIDLKALDIVETDDMLSLVLTVGGFGEQDTSGTYFIDFTWGRVPYTAFVERWANAVGGEWNYGYLGVRQDEEPANSAWEIDGIAPLTPTFDLAAGTITIAIAKAYVLDHEQRPPIKGESIQGIRAYSSRQLFGGMSFNGGSPGAYTDMMPNEGEAAYQFVAGDEATGHIILRSYDRVRVSNGGATTFVFHAIVRNDGDFPDDVELSLVDLPEGWNGSVESKITVPPDTELSVPVLATVPFAHDHGGYTSFGLKAVSKRDASATALLRLGVLHTPVPQPAGHHNELCMHAAMGDESPFRAFFPDTTISMNTVCEHDGEATEVSSMNWGGDMRWDIPLRPSLKMGLDFDIEKLGEMVGSVMGRTSGDADISAQVLLVPDYEGWTDFSDGIVLAESDVQTITLDLQTATPFTLTLTPTEDADYIPYGQGQSLGIVLTLQSQTFTGCCVNQAMPSLLVEDWKTTLPLNEYHDRIIEATGTLGSGLSISTDAPLEKLGRPGTLMTYTFDLKNDLPSEIVIELDLAGTHAQHATIAPEGPITLAPGESRAIVLGVRVPTEAVEGELVEVLLFAHATENPSISAIARTVTKVTLGSDAAMDESQIFAAAQEQENDTPGIGALFVLAALGAAALALRRRR